MDTNVDTVKIFDTTLRDGEQSPGCSMNVDEKLKIAKALDELGVDIIEAGFPAASPGDFSAVNKVAALNLQATIAGLARSQQGDIEAVAKALEPAPNKRLHVFIATSPLHMEFKLQMEKEQVLESIHKSVTFAKKYFDDIEFSAEDAGLPARRHSIFQIQSVTRHHLNLRIYLNMLRMILKSVMILF